MKTSNKLLLAAALTILMLLIIITIVTRFMIGKEMTPGINQRNTNASVNNNHWITSLPSMAVNPVSNHKA
jgi:uncharacterized membrane protein